MCKISVITACMNRGHHLKETLPKNISDNAAYKDIEFVVLDYNSQDDIEEWVKTNLSEHIGTGLLKYYKTYEPQVFHLSHSRNMALKLARAPIVCPIDADSFTGTNYFQWVDDIFTRHGNRTVVTTLGLDDCPHPSQGGKLAYWKEYAHAVKGYDEKMVDYGMEDVDLVRRLEMKGGSRYMIEDADFLRGIDHSDIERLGNFTMLKRMKKIYITSTISVDSTEDREVIYLMEDDQFFKITYEHHEDLKERMAMALNGWVLKEHCFLRGTYAEGPEVLELKFDDGNVEKYNIVDNLLVKQLDPGSSLFMVTREMKYFPQSDGLFVNLVMAISECSNRERYKYNELNADAVNSAGWGRGTVFMNFDRRKPIHLV